MIFKCFLIFVGLNGILFNLFAFLLLAKPNTIAPFLDTFLSHPWLIILAILLPTLLLPLLLYQLFKKRRWFYRGILTLWLLAMISFIPYARTTGYFYTLDEYIMLLFYISLTFFAIGLFNPNFSIRFMQTSKRTRGKSGLIYGILTIALLSIGVATHDKDFEPRSIENTFFGLALSSTIGSNENNFWVPLKGKNGNVDLVTPEQVTVMLYDRESEAVKLSVSDESTASIVTRKVTIPAATKLFKFCFYFPSLGDGDWLTVHQDDNLIFSYSGENGAMKTFSESSSYFMNYKSAMNEAIIGAFYPSEDISNIYITLHGMGPKKSEVILTDFRFLTGSDIKSDSATPGCWTESQ